MLRQEDVTPRVFGTLNHASMSDRSNVKQGGVEVWIVKLGSIEAYCDSEAPIGHHEGTGVYSNTGSTNQFERP